MYSRNVQLLLVDLQLEVVIDVVSAWQQNSLLHVSSLQEALLCTHLCVAVLLLDLLQEDVKVCRPNNSSVNLVQQ